MESNKPVKTFSQIEEETEEQLNTFVFIIFVANPNTHTVRLWIDGGDIESVMSSEKFLDIIMKTCGNAIRNRIDVACHEYGIPYLYDRNKNMLKQLTEIPTGRNFHFSPDYHKKYEQETSDPYSVQNFFNSTAKATKGLENFGIPDFTPKNIRF